MLRNGLLWLVRWPATTTLPTWPGMAVPGQWPGPLSSVDRAMPSYMSAETFSFGMSMWPRSLQRLLDVLGRRRDRRRQRRGRCRRWRRAPA